MKIHMICALKINRSIFLRVRPSTRQSFSQFHSISPSLQAFHLGDSAFQVKQQILLIVLYVSVHCSLFIPWCVNKKTRIKWHLHSGRYFIFPFFTFAAFFSNFSFSTTNPFTCWHFIEHSIRLFQQGCIRKNIFWLDDDLELEMKQLETFVSISRVTGKLKSLYANYQKPQLKSFPCVLHQEQYF